MEKVTFGSGRGGRDSDEQRRMESEIRSLAQNHGCRVARFGGGGFPTWQIKVVEPDGIQSTLVAEYCPVANQSRIILKDQRGARIAADLKRLLETSFHYANVEIWNG